MDASAGAPPDAFFTRGQSWGFPPMRPDAMREERFDYVIRCVRQQLRYAGILRIDHIMGLHRLFWVPVGSEAKDGVYVRYPDQELFAILAIESHRHRSVIIGEDLGTVPEEIHQLMKARGVKRMFVLQYELSPAAPVPQEPPQDAIASLNTHDMPMFHSFWYGRDIDDRAELRLLDAQGAGEERRGREEIRRRLVEFFERRGLHGDPLDAALLFLAGSDAEIVLLTLEDLWRESEPQNVPGTSALERPNWQRKLRQEIADAFDLPEVRERLRGVEQRRRG